MRAFYTIFLITLSFSLSVQWFFDDDSDDDDGDLSNLVNSFIFQYKLQAAPPTVSLLRRYDNRFSISPNQLPHELQNTLVPALHHEAAALASGKISGIGQRILLSIGIGQQIVQHEHWEFHLMDGIGRLLVFQVRAQIYDYDVHITGGIAEVVQNIPEVFDKQVQCASTGRRRYIGIFGPREEECVDYWFQRGLNHDEIRMVQDTLMTKISTALHMLQ